MKFNKLSIIIPVYNEEDYIALVLDKIKHLKLNSRLSKELLIIDDCSTDSTEERIKSFIYYNKSLIIKYYKHNKNKGKGACIRNGIANSSGEIILIQDADLEYDPKEYDNLTEPIIDGYADVVYGSRFKGAKPNRVLFFWHYLGNKFLTLFSNIFSNLNLTDMETCYKVFKAEVLKSILLKENRFGFEPEVTAKISQINGIRIYEIGISYYGRDYSSGKKINWKDGIAAIWFIIKYNLFNQQRQK